MEPLGANAAQMDYGAYERSVNQRLGQSYAALLAGRPAQGERIMGQVAGRPRGRSVAHFQLPPGQPATNPDTFPWSGHSAHTREGIVQIFFGCQNVMIYAAEGHVELLLSMDPSGQWQRLTPDAAEELGQWLIRASQGSRLNDTHNGTQQSQQEG